MWLLPALSCDKLWIPVVSGWLWVSRHRVILTERCTSSASQMRSSRRKCKVGVKQLAVRILPRSRFYRGWTSCGNRKVSAGITMYHQSLWKPVVSKSFSVWSCQNYSSTPPIIKAHFMVTGCVHLHPSKPLLILPLNIYHSTENTPSILWPCVRGHDSWRVHPQPHQTSNVFITVTSHWHQFCLNPKRGGEKRMRWMEKERANWRVGWSQRAGIRLSIHQRGDAALQISWSSFVMFSACQWP